MQKYWLSNHLQAVHVLCLDDHHRPMHEMALENVSDEEKLLGTYFTYPSGFIGLYGDNGKIMLLIGEQKFDLADPHLTLELHSIDTKKHFTAKYDKDVMADFTYVPPEPISWDPYSDEEDDFLLSVVNLKLDPARLDAVARDWALG